MSPLSLCHMALSSGLGGFVFGFFYNPVSPSGFFNNNKRQHNYHIVCPSGFFNNNMG
jgi:hypothetical protein